MWGKTWLEADSLHFESIPWRPIRNTVPAAFHHFSQQQTTGTGITDNGLMQVKAVPFVPLDVRT